MSRSEGTRSAAKRAVALQYGPNDAAPVIVASGMGYLAEKIVEVASESGVPVYEDNSLATMLSQLALGQEIRRLYQVFDTALKEKEKFVLKMRYGLFGCREHTQREIAAQMGISRSYVSRIEKKALGKLREKFEQG